MVLRIQRSSTVCSDHSEAIEFLKDIGLIRTTMQCGSCVKGELLGPRTIGVRLSGTVRGFRTIGSPSKKLCF
jgi:hypothetical protein